MHSQKVRLFQEVNDGFYGMLVALMFAVGLLAMPPRIQAAQYYQTNKGIQKIEWGRAGGEAVYLYTLNSEDGVTAKVTNYGALLTELHVPDRNGKLADVVLGFDALDGYLTRHPYFGCTVGRVANRVAEGKFTLDKQAYTLVTNNGPNHLHGGEKGFDKQVWEVTDAENTAAGASLTMVYTSPDGEEGYPGNLTVTVRYMLNKNGLEVNMRAETDAPTIVNLANHSYWNLAGHDSGQILNHELTLNADRYTPTDATLIPTGEIASVAETPYDFRESKKIGADIGRLPGDGAGDPGGYDINFALNGEAHTMRLAARATESSGGRTMEVHTNAPGVQFYSGNFLNGSVTGKNDAVYKKHAAFCLETQHYPDAINKEGKPGWPSVILRPGQVYRHSILFKFSTE